MVSPPSATHAPRNPPGSNELIELQALNTSSPGSTKVARTTSDRQTPSWWSKHVQAQVPLKACRDHLANERTYLAHLRTSATVAQFGILLVALFRINNQPGSTSPSAHPSLFQIGIPLAAASILLAIIVLIAGTHRYFKTQRLMAATPSMVASGGWELWVGGGGVVMVSHSAGMDIRIQSKGRKAGADQRVCSIVVVWGYLHSAPHCAYEWLAVVASLAPCDDQYT